ncbi:hypothetical protein ASU33_04525 [Solirubrum puertoriconensis]|uniref:Uncharacterized protein n=1 Tax=Solirubrum puertoriconensis TaxID=1751427 RepID=A0A9X0HIQ0_SOLP1|nr:hypothetical protein ASU33_04525 [Solirubrum puertoriconensis]
MLPPMLVLLPCWPDDWFWSLFWLLPDDEPPLLEEALVVLPDFLADAEDEVEPVADLLPDLLDEDPPDLPEVLPPVLPPRPPWPMLVEAEARSWLEVVEPDERPLLSLLPLVRPEVEEPDWLPVLPCIPPEVVEPMLVEPVPEVLP